MPVGAKDALLLCAAGVALARLLSWKWKTSNECVCVWCKRKSPKRIILVRHGQSEGNENPDLYRVTPDNAMHMTGLGRLQARAAGKCMKEIIGNESVRCIVSPCVRTIETFEEILSAWGEDAHHIPWTEEPRIREQDFGNFQDPEQIRQCKSQRRKFGSFFYRFPSGESPAGTYFFVLYSLILTDSCDLRRVRPHFVVLGIPPSHVRATSAAKLHLGHPWRDHPRAAHALL
ncbi:hypothetical protein, variant [Aphanomyces astaci]|uniref:Phosphoglycerate mutase (2,3-diphosphoglycerate-dependent) n=1 Tax=Aphanomyces astaci TaxID=112090 RepID=W4HC84_APHAT|nr:hypothetical protein, variant [Aphanomyces astaci]ETV89196.1 hypothetical protein, variant [Aphanomyces astaci]|eukprot:XP_009821596.1 hypothetical protein, variant [Aphanomyces astaci]